MDKMKMESVDMTEQNIEKIGAMFPNCLTETVDKNGKPQKAINFELLKQMLSEDVLDGDEAYEFTWVGKKAAIVEANKPIRKTLRPCKEESKDWDTTENLYIEGDNLEVLKLLQESYLGKVKMIYIDPPYNTGNDFIYKDNFAMSKEDYNEEQGIYDEDENRLFQNNNSNGRFHSDWCSMIYPRLNLARNLLSEDGVIFISIDDNEVENLKKICNEVFGESNFITIIGLEITKTQGMKVKAAKDGSVVKNYEYVICYAKDTTNKKIVENILYDENVGYDTHFSYYIEKSEDRYIVKKLTEVLKENEEIYNEFKKYNLTNSKGLISITSIQKAIQISDKIRQYIFYDISEKVFQEMACSISIDAKIDRLLDNESVIEYNDYLLTKTSGGKLRQYGCLSETLNNNDEYKSEYGRVTIRGNLWKGFYSDMMNVAKEGEVEYKNGKKPTRLIYQLAKWIGTKSGDTILDFFSGSATTAHAIMELNAYDDKKRKYIMIQINENLDESLNVAAGENKETIKSTINFLDSIDKPHLLTELGKERIIRAGEKINGEIIKNNNRSNIGKEDKPLVDIGFRVFKIDSSNMTDVYYSADEYNQQMLQLMESNVKADRTDLDLLFSCLLEWGLPLSMSYKSEQIEECTVHTYNDGDLIACFDKNISESVVKTIAKRQPLRAVFRDSSFANSSAKINVTEIFKLLAPDTRVKVI